jgi:predicted restriction endonuclease
MGGDMSRKVDGLRVSERLAHYIQKSQSLRRDKYQERPRPHKPIMLLAVLSLADSNSLLKNHIVYDSELLELNGKRVILPYVSLI